MLVTYYSLYVKYSKRPNIKDYEFKESIGIYIHNKKNGFFCPECLVQNHLEARLSREPNTNKFECSVCHWKIEKRASLPIV